MYFRGVAHYIHQIKIEFINHPEITHNSGTRTKWMIKLHNHLTANVAP